MPSIARQSELTRAARRMRRLQATGERIAEWAERRRDQLPRRHWRALELRVWALLWWRCIDMPGGYPTPPTPVPNPRPDVGHYQLPDCVDVPRKAMIRALRQLGLSLDDATWAVPYVNIRTVLRQKRDDQKRNRREWRDIKRDPARHAAVREANRLREFRAAYRHAIAMDEATARVAM